MVNKKNNIPSRFCLKHLFKKSAFSKHDPADEETAKRIESAALQEFSLRGYEGARMQNIADLAGVNKALLHYHHKNKDMLYQKILSKIETIFWEGLSPIINAEDLNAKQFIENMVSGIFEILLTYPIEHKIFMQELANGGPFLKVAGDDLQNLCDSKVTGIIGRLVGFIQKGEIRPLDPIHMFLNIMSMCQGSFLMRPLMENSNVSIMPKIDRKFYEARCEAIAEMVCNGILTPTEEDK